MYAEAVITSRHALTRIAHVLNLIEATGRAEAVLSARLAPAMLPCRSQLACALGFALRAALPLAGRQVPDMDLNADLTVLRRRVAAADAMLDGLSPVDFADAAQRMISHRAGFADHEQSGADYLRLFALPNLWFHLTMAFAILRCEGVDLGKADFDGLHGYPPGFQFDDP